MKLIDDDQLVQLATRIPRSIARTLKAYCVTHDVRMQSFVRSALAEKPRSRVASRRSAGR
jgi:hypothetical protein